MHIELYLKHNTNVFFRNQSLYKLSCTKYSQNNIKYFKKALKSVNAHLEKSITTQIPFFIMPNSLKTFFLPSDSSA